MKLILSILCLLFPIMIIAQTKDIEISVDNFCRIYFDAHKIMATDDSQISIDYWGKVISEKQLLDKFIVCLEVSYCDFELKSNPKIAEQRSEYILSRFENDYQIN